jgi:formylmethanofuran dehydrogenase subunit E
MFEFNAIGFVKSKFREAADPFKMREEESIIAIKEEYADGLYRITDAAYLEIIFCFHRSQDYELKLTNYYGEFKGVFATRSPRRPVNIGLSKVKLLKHEGNLLYVQGLDALDGTPVLDIKPYTSGYVADERDNAEYSELKQNPRRKIVQLTRNNKLTELLILAGTLHGHYCPGLAMGVIAATYAVNHIRESADGLEDLLAVVEINSCFVDAIQYITGCSLGNNALIYRDLGKTAFSLVKRNGSGIRLSVKPSYAEKQREQNPGFSYYFDKVVVGKSRDQEELLQFKKLAREASFDLLGWDIKDIYKIEEVKLKLPDYAPVRSTVFCAKCGEGIMQGKEEIVNDNPYCKTCGGISCWQLDGTGITDIKI